jgi:hypothetical protein
MRVALALLFTVASILKFCLTYEPRSNQDMQREFTYIEVVLGKDRSK